jgi:hypothetical protein
MGRRTGVLLIAVALVVGLALGFVLWGVDGVSNDTAQACHEARSKLLRGEVTGGDRLDLDVAVRNHGENRWRVSRHNALHAILCSDAATKKRE